MSYQKQRTEKHLKRSKKSQDNFQLSKLKKLPPINKNLLIVVMMLIIFGIVAIFSASAPEGVDHYANPLFYPINHLKFAIVGFFLMFLTSRIHFKNWEKWVIPVSLFIIALIAATLVPGLGKTSYGSSRWLTFLPIQPSEFGKFACILLMASCLSKAKSLKDPIVQKHGFIILIMLGIILKQPNMSMCIILIATSFSMLFVGGASLTLFGIGTAAVIPLIGLVIAKMAYQSKRIIGWLHPEADPQGMGYNIIQSWYAISSGGLFGAGIGNSKQKLYYLPFGHTDFIFSVIAEELGFVGICVLISLFLIFINIGFKIASRCEDQFGKLLAFGITFIIGFQAFINMCVASGVFPVTGVTLPLISYGGSSFIVTTAMIGVLMNISRYSVKRERHSQNENKTKQPQT